MKKFLVGAVLMSGLAVNAQTIDTVHLVPQGPQSCGTLFSCTNISNLENVGNISFSAAAGDPYNGAPTASGYGVTCRASTFSAVYFPVSRTTIGRNYTFTANCYNIINMTASPTVVHGVIKMYARLVLRSPGVYTAVGAVWSVQPGSTLTFETP